MDEAAAETRAIVTSVLHDLRRPVRRTRVEQKLHRWTGQASFQLGRHAKNPSEVHLAGIGITPLWEAGRDGPDDLDLLRPMIVTRRFTLGHTWTLTHDSEDFHAVVVLVVADTRAPWLVLPDHAKFPANAYGWRKAHGVLGVLRPPRRAVALSHGTTSTGQASFQLGPHAREPSEVYLAGLGITPLWEAGRTGPD